MLTLFLYCIPVTVDTDAEQTEAHTKSGVCFKQKTCHVYL